MFKPSMRMHVKPTRKYLLTLGKLAGIESPTTSSVGEEAGRWKLSRIALGTSTLGNPVAFAM